MKQTNHTNFLHFAKMLSSNFPKTFPLIWHKIRCIVLHKKKKICQKKANHTISMY